MTQEENKKEAAEKLRRILQEKPIEEKIQVEITYQEPERKTE